MRTTVVPAQITSVEDRIAGNLTFNQILLLIMALLIGAGLYVGITPHSQFTPLKLAVILVQCIVFGGLAIRINGKIVADWLVVYLRFFLRPRLYVFTKNDLTNRDVAVPPTEKRPAPKPQPIEKPIGQQPAASFAEQVRLDRLLDNPGVSVTFTLAEKGGMDVSLTPIKD